jgi:hypothetical protein
MTKQHTRPTDTGSPTLRDFYPDMSDEELKEAEENLVRYVEFTVRMNKRLFQESQEKGRSLEEIAESTEEK